MSSMILTTVSEFILKRVQHNINFNWKCKDKSLFVYIYLICTVHTNIYEDKHFAFLFAIKKMKFNGCYLDTNIVV